MLTLASALTGTPAAAARVLSAWGTRLRDDVVQKGGANRAPHAPGGFAHRDGAGVGQPPGLSYAVAAPSRCFDREVDLDRADSPRGKARRRAGGVSGTQSDTRIGPLRRRNYCRSRDLKFGAVIEADQREAREIP